MRPGNKRSLVLNSIALSTALSGVLALSSTLFALVHLHRARIVLADAHLTVIAGLSLIYLAMLLRRGKRNAWLVALAVYSLLIIRNYQHFIFDDDHLLLGALNLVIPATTLLALVVFKKVFTVRSEIRSFALAIRRTAIILAAAFLYGVIGFQLLDTRDFYREISVPTAIHYTLDQSGFTTNNEPVAQTKRARFFVDSLAAVSITSVVYAALAFFAPIRFRLTHHEQDYQDAEKILGLHATTSEDFFKLWPRDKAYFFNLTRSAVIAYRVVGGVALAVGDPAGPQSRLEPLISQFTEYCRLNGWTPSFVHTEPANLKTYSKFGFAAQKIGEEAVVNTAHFTSEVARNKYFRHINNKFTKQSYSFEILDRIDIETMGRLKQISDEWLMNPVRAERGFMMGYFTPEYIEKCRVAVVRDASGQVQSFLNQVPSPKKDEANYDFLRNASGAMSNINDFLMINFIGHLKSEGVAKLNMGLAPLTGLEPGEQSDRSAIDRLLHFVYSSANRFYSFQGLVRFKDKYEPDWQGRYVLYRGGLPGFTRTMNALLRAMNR